LAQAAARKALHEQNKAERKDTFEQRKAAERRARPPSRVLTTRKEDSMTISAQIQQRVAGSTAEREPDLVLAAVPEHADPALVMTRVAGAGMTAGTKLAGRVALVTGGTRGIGAAIGASLAGQGAAIAAGYSGNVQRATDFVAQMGERFKGAAAVTLHQGNIGQPRGLPAGGQ
jgi:hypothetical protein